MRTTSSCPSRPAPRHRARSRCSPSSPDDAGTFGQVIAWQAFPTTGRLDRHIAGSAHVHRQRPRSRGRIRRLAARRTDPHEGSPITPSSSPAFCRLAPLAHDRPSRPRARCSASESRRRPLRCRHPSSLRPLPSTSGPSTRSGRRLYHEPLADGRTMVGWTDASMNGHVSIVGTTVQTTFDFPAEPVCGPVAHANGHLRGPAPERRQGRDTRTTSCVSRSATRTEPRPGRPRCRPCPGRWLELRIFDWRQPESARRPRRHGAYMKRRLPDPEYEGDRYQRAQLSERFCSAGWAWGLSHSMAGVIAPHPETAARNTPQE